MWRRGLALTRSVALAAMAAPFDARAQAANGIPRVAVSHADGLVASLAHTARSAKAPCYCVAVIPPSR
jgi:hypothetical protein